MYYDDPWHSDMTEERPVKKRFEKIEKAPPAFIQGARFPPRKPKV